MAEVHIHVDTPERAAAVAKALEEFDASPTAVVKESAEQRYVLGVAYQSGPDPRIGMGADGGRDYFQPVELEKAAWSYIPNGAGVNLFHDDRITGHATVVESYVYRGPDWQITGPDGSVTVVKAGDWLVGAILDDVAWQLYKEDRITGWSPQGTATRIRRRSQP